MLKKDLASKRLVGLGVSLIDETRACPLCLTPWEPNALKTFLEKRQKKPG